MDGFVFLELEWSPEDEATSVAAKQRTLRRVAAKLRADGTVVAAGATPCVAGAVLAGILSGGLSTLALQAGEVANQLAIQAKTLGPEFVVVVVAWLHGRSGRKAKLKVGDIQLEATTREDVERLFVLVRDHTSKKHDDSAQ